MKPKKIILILFLTLFAFSANSQVAIPALEVMVQKYAPILRHHHEERYLSSSAEWYLNRSNLYKRTSSIPFVEMKADLANRNWGMLDGAAKATGNKSADRKWFIHRKNGSTNTGNIASTKAYVHVKLANYQPYPKYDFDIEIQYWFFWPYNDATEPLGVSDHHGDWEGVTVVLDSDGNFKYLLTTSHGDRNYYETQHLEWGGPFNFPYTRGTHPVIQVARKSHALYNKNGKYNYVAFKYRDRVEGIPGVKEVESWKSYEIIELDSRIKNSGIVPTRPGWTYFGGNWGTTNNTSTSPQFVRQDKPEWEGRYNDGLIFYNSLKLIKIDIPYDYYLPHKGNTDLRINGITSTNCANKDYRLKINSSVNKRVKWTVPSSGFTPSSGTTYNNNAFHTSGRDRNAGGDIIAKVFLPQELNFDASFNVKKRVNLKKPQASDYSISSYVSNYNSTSCMVTFFLRGNSGISDYSVNWNKYGGHGTLLSSNNYQAKYKVDKDRFINVSPEIDICNSNVVVYAFEVASCGSGSGGPIDYPIDDGGGIGFKSIAESGVIFPNPTTGSFKIAIDNSEITDAISVEIYDLNGKLVEQKKEIQTENSVLELDYPQLNSGIYRVRVTSHGVMIYQGKLIKQ